MTVIDDVTIEGDDAQNAIGNTVSGDFVQNQIRFVRTRPSMVLTESMITDRITDYVPASNHDEIVESLRRQHAVALSGAPDSGVMTTAIAAVRDLRPDLPLRYFSTGDDDVAEIQFTTPHGYLVRARDEQKERLWACLEAVRAADGFLLLVGEPHEFAKFAELLTVIPVQPPAADSVYRLRLHNRGLGAGWLNWPPAAGLLKKGLPGEGRRLADLVLAVVANGGDGCEVERAYQGWAEQLREWFTAHQDARDRALMVAAATITPADETSVYGAALSLARLLEIPVAGGGLAWRPATALVPLLGADRDDDRIVFRRTGYADAVLRHVWDEYPLTRVDLLQWLPRLASGDFMLEPTLRTKIAEVFADLAAEHGSAEVITQTARDWIGMEQRGANLAYVVLARTCLHPLVGGRVRTTLYEWSREHRAPQTLKLMVARVCQVLGETYMSIALTRLKHLATYGNAQVQDEVFTVARALADADPRHVFQTALRWCHEAGQMTGRDAARRARIALRLLLALLRDEPQPGAGAGASVSPRLRNVLGAIAELAARGDPKVSPVLLDNTLDLATDHPAIMIERALAWAGATAQYAVSMLGTNLFLGLAAERDPAGTATILTAPSAIAPEASVHVWAMALSAELRWPRGSAYFRRAFDLWLDTAAARPDLRAQIISALTRAAGADPRRAGLVIDHTRVWAAHRPGGRDVRDRVLSRLLTPLWKRYLLRLWVELFRTSSA